MQLVSADDNGQHRLQAFEQADLVKVESFEWTEMESFLSSSANGSLEQSAQIPNENVSHNTSVKS